MLGSALKRVVVNWLARHRNPTSLALHIVGIPACFVAAPILVLLRQWVAGAVCFVAGYALQFVGHIFEGSRSGEGMLLRRLLRRK